MSRNPATSSCTTTTMLMNEKKLNKPFSTDKAVRQLIF